MVDGNIRSEKTENTVRVMTSWMVFSCAKVNSYEPMRFAGTWKQYSANAMSQLMTITLNSGAWRYFKWPYQAIVMKMLERVNSRIVIMRICCLIPGFVAPVMPCRLRAGLPQLPCELLAILHPSGWVSPQ